jgi:hypothetical protein
MLRVVSIRACVHLIGIIALTGFAAADDQTDEKKSFDKASISRLRAVREIMQEGTGARRDRDTALFLQNPLFDNSSAKRSGKRLDNIFCNTQHRSQSCAPHCDCIPTLNATTLWMSHYDLPDRSIILCFRYLLRSGIE